MYNTGVVGFMLAFVISFLPDRQSELPTASCIKHFVFVIDIDSKTDKTSVENSAGWRCIGELADSIPSCAPGMLQACQLVVDERDTELLTGEQNLRKLKPGVRITALLNSAGTHWFVSNYTPVGNYLYRILNEENHRE